MLHDSSATCAHNSVHVASGSQMYEQGWQYHADNLLLSNAPTVTLRTSFKLSQPGETGLGPHTPMLERVINYYYYYSATLTADAMTADTRPPASPPLAYGPLQYRRWEQGSTRNGQKHIFACKDTEDCFTICSKAATATQGLASLHNMISLFLNTDKCTTVPHNTS